MSGGNGPYPPLPADAQAQASAIITWTPVTVVLIVGVCASLWRLRAWMLAKRATDEADFEQALRSDKLEILGAYLRDQLGALRLDAFADSDKVRDRTKKYLGRLREYLNQPAPPQPATQDEDQFEAEQSAALGESARTSAPITEAQNLLAENKGWSAFALLRRELERALRSKGLVREKQPLPPPSTVEPKYLQAAYGIFLRTANRSIHGEDLSADEEERAMMAAAFLFERLDEMQVRLADRYKNRGADPARSS